MTWLNFASSKDLVLFLLAIYGAALSTFNWRQSVRRDRRMIVVSLNTLSPVYEDGHLGLTFARIEATNKGHRTVTVKMLALELGAGGRIFNIDGDRIRGMPDTSLPAELADGRSAQMMIFDRDIGTALLKKDLIGTVTLTPVAEDLVGSLYKGEPWEVNPKEFVRM